MHRVYGFGGFRIEIESSGFAGAPGTKKCPYYVYLGGSLVPDLLGDGYWWQVPLFGHKSLKKWDDASMPESISHRQTKN